MSKTILTEVDGWTPLIDSIVQTHGVMTAAVFGRVWRYCQMADGTCSASEDRIADDLGMHRNTVGKHLDILVENGYLEKQDRDGRPAIYRDTGKASLRSTITAVDQPTRGRKKKPEPAQNLCSPTGEPAQKMFRPDEEPAQNLCTPAQKMCSPTHDLGTTCTKNVQEPAQNLCTKKVLRDSLRDDSKNDSRNGSAPPGPSDPSFLDWWESALGQVRREMGQADYETWLRPLQPKAYQNGVLLVEGVNSYGVDWCRSRLSTKLERLIAPFAGRPVEIEFVVRGQQ